MVGSVATKTEKERSTGKAEGHAPEPHYRASLDPYASIMNLQHTAGNRQVNHALGLQTQCPHVSLATAPSVVDEVLINDPGKPLDFSERELMQTRLGFNLNSIRLHTNSLSDSSAQALNARAFTAGNHIVFQNNAYAPATEEGQNLLAHELSHVAEQGGYNNGYAQLAPKASGAESDTTETMKRELVDIVEIITAMSTLKDPSTGEWHKLALRKEWLATLFRGEKLSFDDDSHSLDPSILEQYFSRKSITWETITDDQKKVLGALDTAQRERIRKAALPNSTLFKTITNLHIRSDTPAANLPAQRKGWNNLRMKEPHPIVSKEKSPSEAVADPETAAEALTYSTALEDAIIDPAGTATPAKNEGLTKWVRSQTPKQARHSLHSFACGITALYALDQTYGGAAPTDPNRSPAFEDVVAWINKHTIGSIPSAALFSYDVAAPYLLTTKALESFVANHAERQPVADSLKPMADKPVVDKSSFIKQLEELAGKEAMSKYKQLFLSQAEPKLRYNPTSVLRVKKATASNNNPYDSSNKKTVPKTEALAHNAFQEFMNLRERSTSPGARLALAQGIQETHTFLIYKDIDDIWRTMDVYLGGEDRGWEKLGFPHFSQKISSIYFIEDPLTKSGR